LVNETIQEETHQVFRNIQGVLEAEGMDFSNVVKASVFMSDMELYSEINEVYTSYFVEGTLPAREAVAVKTLPKNVRVEISVIAVK
jgi:2-iminobutanoate/2-iminopropanoate deaminase